MMKDITNPMEYVECIIAFDCLDWSTDPRHAAIYAIVLGWDGEDGNDECYIDLQNRYKWSDEFVKRLKNFHEEWNKIRDGEQLVRCKDCKYYSGKWCKRNAISDFDLNDIMKSADDFCSSAERKEE